MNQGLLVALSSGLFAGTSACALPLYPVLLNHLTHERENPRWVSLFFSLGLAGTYFLVYAFAGSLSAVLGLGFFEAAEQWRGRLLLFAALYSWLMAWRTLSGGLTGKTLQLLKPVNSRGYSGVVASGAVYGAVITPCNTPFLLTGILPALASGGGTLNGIILLALFSAAMASPILLLGWASGTALSTFKLIREKRKLIEKTSALFLVLAGLYFMQLFLKTR